MTLAEYCQQKGIPEDSAYSHLLRHGICSSNCTKLADIASPDHAECIEHLRGLNAFHLQAIINKSREAQNRH